MKRRGGHFDFAFSEDDLMTQAVDKVVKENELFESLAKAVIATIKKDRTLSFQDALRQTVRSNREIQRYLEQVKENEIREKILKMEVSDLLSVLTQKTAEAENVQYSHAFTEVQTKYPELIAEYVFEMRGGKQR